MEKLLSTAFAQTHEKRRVRTEILEHIFLKR